MSVFEGVVRGAGYQLVIPPIFEDVGVFRRIGEGTDVVSKEMYDFEDKGGRHIALRPEHTAGLCRAYVQHRPTTPWKVWYSGSNFRYEKAQAGRYRQFDQVGIEALGVDDPLLDAEVIALGWKFFAALGLRGVELRLNSLGDGGDRARYVEVLRAYLESRSAELSEESRATLTRNPLRVLDSKRPSDRAVVEEAPLLSAHLGDGARAHFAAVRAGLDRLGIPYTLSPRLVRGLDYYVRTAFEFTSTSLESAQNAIGGGGRYDGLVEEMGGPSTPGVGFALGVDRTLLACDAERCFPPDDGAVEVFVIDTLEGWHALEITSLLREYGVAADRAYEGRSMKSQMKSADRSGAVLAVIVGEDEQTHATCTLRNLRTSEQETVRRDSLVERVVEVLTKHRGETPT